jgi:DNA-binding transcriptional MerR regulator
MSYELRKPYTDKQRIDFIVQYNHEKGLQIEETDEALYALEVDEIMQDGVPIKNPNYEEELEAKEKARIQELSMTRSDFFDGTIMAWGVGQDELLLLIQGLLATLPIAEVQKLIAINNFKNALNFYRKHDLFKMLVNIPIKLTDTIQVTITDEHLDKFFDEVDKGNKETAWQYLPQPVMIPIEETEVI